MRIGAVTDVTGSRVGLLIMSTPLQILLNPYVYEKQKPILEFAKEHGIVVEAYSALRYILPFETST